MEWAHIARQTIERVALTIPDDATFKDRKTVIDAAYPFGPREYWPYKAWLKARRSYLAKWNPNAPKTPLFADLERDPETGRPVVK